MGLLIEKPLRTLIHFFLGAAGFFADQGVTVLSSPQLWLVILFYLCLAAFVILRRRRWKYLSLALSAFVLFIVLNARHPERSDNLRLHFLDVGQGDSILIEYPDATFDLVDGGGFFNSEALDTGQSLVIPYLCKKGVTKLNRVFLTHAHADHMNGLITVLRYIPVQELYVSRQPFGDRGYQYFLRSIAKSPAPICRGKSFNQGGVHLEVLAPGDSNKTRRVANDDSLVLLLQYADRRVLLTGDVESEAEAGLSRDMQSPVDLMKVPHHGSRSSSSDAFLKKIHPKIAVASLGFNNWFGHPHKEVLDRYKRGHAVFYRTDQDGTVVITVSRRGMELNIN
jgi:competence protein ComEC